MTPPSSPTPPTAPRTSASVEVGRVIAQARQRRGWSQTTLRDQLGSRRRSAIARWEAGLGIGVSALLEVVTLLPEVGDHLIGMIHRAQQQQQPAGDPE
jgi:proline-rich tail region repeat protein